MVKKAVISVLLLLLLVPVYIYSQFRPYNLLVPKPRQAYTREIFSGVFSLTNDKKIYLNPKKPLFKVAEKFNSELRKRNLDTLQVTLWKQGDSLLSGIALDIVNEELTKFFLNIPDQKIPLSPLYPGPEGYVIDILPMQLIIAGCDESGLYYGLNTFFQLLDINKQNPVFFASRIIDAPEFPVRWVYYSTNIQVPANIDKAKEIWANASKLKLNGIQLNDSKFARISNLPKWYYDSLSSLVNYSHEKNLKIIPGFFSFGYSNDMLFHDPNMASGLPVENQKFVIEGDTARLVPHGNVNLPNPGFENYTADKFSGFTFYDNSGAPDETIKHSGRASIKFSGFSGTTNARINYRQKMNPFTYYHVSGWVRTENLQFGDDIKIIAIGNKNPSLIFSNIGVPSNTNGWKKVDVVFNSLESDTVGVYWGVWGVSSGTIWWDDILIEEVPFVNLIRRPGAPLRISHQFLDIAYVEGVDYDTLRDPLTGNIQWPGDYNTWHKIPTLRIKTAGNLHNGDTILMSYYHAVVIYDGQVSATMSEQMLYDILDNEFAELHRRFNSDTYFMHHDEIRTMNWDFGDRSRDLSPAEILADNVKKCMDIIHKYKPAADIWSWSDMFDDYHNASPKRQPYYLVRGSLSGNADLLPKELGIAKWYLEPNQIKESIDFFPSKGFRQISAPYYDSDENNIRIWKERTKGSENFNGMMYTTWQSKYTHLEPFAEYSWNHAPYIYHYPPFAGKPIGNINIDATITGDKWDKGWLCDKLMVFYRLHPASNFVSFQAVPKPDNLYSLTLDLPADNQWLQYYLVGYDNRGWATRIPFGDSVYFELGEIINSIEEPNYNNNLRISPNPATSGSSINVEWLSYYAGFGKIIITDLLGNKIKSLELSYSPGNVQSAMIDLTGFQPGAYFIHSTDGFRANTGKIIILGHHE